MTSLVFEYSATCHVFLITHWGWMVGGEGMVLVWFGVVCDSSWVGHMFKSGSQNWVEATLGEKQGYFWNFPTMLLFAHPLVKFVCFAVSYPFSNTMFWIFSLNCKTSVLWRGLNTSSAFGILILSSRVSGNLSADLVSEIYIQSTNTNETIK